MKLTGKQIADIKKLAKTGLSERAIAKKVGCSRSSVWHYKNN